MPELRPLPPLLRWARQGGRTLLLPLLASAPPLAAGLWAGGAAAAYLLMLGSVLGAAQWVGTRGAGVGTGSSAGSGPQRIADAQATKPYLATLRPLSAALWPMMAALLLAAVLARLPGAAGPIVVPVVLTVMLMAAATLAHYSRPAALAGGRFSVWLVLALGLIAGHAGRPAALLLFGAGAGWAALLAWLLPASEAGPNGGAAAAAVSRPARQPTPRQRRQHWRRMLATLAGWDHALRLGGALCCACVLRQAWPQHHFDWIVLGVVLMTPRSRQRLGPALRPRLLGTAAGVVIAGVLLQAGTQRAAVLLLACLLGALALLVRGAAAGGQGEDGGAAGSAEAREGRGAEPSAGAGDGCSADRRAGRIESPSAGRVELQSGLYCALTTALILLAIDGGASLGPALLADRLLATGLAAALVLGASLCSRRWLNPG